MKLDDEVWIYSGQLEIAYYCKYGVITNMCYY